VEKNLHALFGDLRANVNEMYKSKAKVENALRWPGLCQIKRIKRCQTEMHWANFYFLIFSTSWGRICSTELFRMKISIDLDSLQPYPTSRNLLKIDLKNRVPTILFIAPFTEVVPICRVNLVIGR